MKLKKKCTPRLGFSRTRIEPRSYTNPQEFFNQNQSAILLTPLSFAFQNKHNDGLSETPAVAKTAKSIVKNFILRPQTQQSSEARKNNTVALTYEQYGRLASKKLIKPNYFQKLADINDHILNKKSKVAQIKSEENAKKTIFRQLFDRKERIQKKVEKKQYIKPTNSSFLQQKMKNIATCDLSALSSHIILQKLESKWQNEYAEEMKKRALALTQQSQFGSNNFGSQREQSSVKSKKEVSGRGKGKQMISNSVDAQLRPFFDKIFGKKSQIESQSNQYEFNCDNLISINASLKRRNVDYSSTKNRKHSSFKPMLQWKSH